MFLYGLPEKKNPQPLVLLNLTSVLKRINATNSASERVIEISDSSSSSDEDISEEFKPDQNKKATESASETDSDSENSSSFSDTESSSSESDSSSSDSEEEYRPEQDDLSSDDETRKKSMKTRPLKITLKLGPDGNYTRS